MIVRAGHYMLNTSSIHEVRKRLGRELWTTIRSRFDRDTYGDEGLPQYFDDILRIGIMPVPDFETRPVRQNNPYIQGRDYQYGNISL